MARHDVAGILDADTALDPGLEEIADNAADARKKAARKGQRPRDATDMERCSQEPDDERGAHAAGKAFP